jgi:hypothetical protein
MKPTFQTVVGLMLNAGMSLHEAEEHLRDAIVHEALRRSKGNRTRAARLLRVHRNTFTRLLPVAERRSAPKFRSVVTRIPNLADRIEKWEHGVKIPAVTG